MNRDDVIRQCKKLGPWFHQIDLGDGLRTRDIAPREGPQQHDHPLPRWNKIKDVVPADLSGKRILDIGCCDGFFSVELAKRNAREIVSIDGAAKDIKRLQWVKEHLGLEAIKPYVCDLYQLDKVKLGPADMLMKTDEQGRLFAASLLARTLAKAQRHLGGTPAAKAATPTRAPQQTGIGKFDIVFMLAVLYHLRDPLTALEIVAKLGDTLYIETIALLDETNSHLQLIPPREGVNPNPKWFPTTRCVKDMLKLAGYKSIDEVSPPEPGNTSDTRVIYIARK